MRKKIKWFFIKLIIIVLVLQPNLVSAGVPEAVDYLKTQASDAWITQALVAAGENDVEVDYLVNFISDLEFKNEIQVTDYAKTILTLATAGENPLTFGDNYVVKLKSYYNNSQMGETGFLNDDVWSILALASIGQVDSVEAVAAKDFLLANQNDDGGWGYAVGGNSDTNSTAVGIMALVDSFSN